MNNQTVVNPVLQKTASTVVNPDIISEYNQQNQVPRSNSDFIKEGFAPSVCLSRHLAFFMT